jgi:hypothetical protein
MGQAPDREVDDSGAETARLSRILGRTLIPVDVVVVSERDAQRWPSVTAALVHEAMRRAGSLPSPNARELALLLIGKAQGTSRSSRSRSTAPAVADVADDALGFHVQQAVERRLNAVLVHHEVANERTPSISYLG